jgi:membrane-associated phospholipid phosphatase
MKILCRFGLFVVACCAGAGVLSNPCRAQVADASLPDSPSFAAPIEPSAQPAYPVPGAELADPAPAADPTPGADRRPFNPSVERETTWRTLPRNFLQDQKDIWTFPVHLARGRHWIPTLAVAGVTTGLIYADPHVMPYFRKHAENLDDLNDTFDAYITTAEVVAVPVGLMVAGYARHDQRSVSSALLCAQAYGDSTIVNLAIKAVTRRQRPVDVPIDGNYHDTFFNGGKSPFHGSSFPSGHTTAVFSVATVVANRYARHRWVPYVSYAFATVISLSRITTAAHWPSDVFLGAAIGYSTAKYVVLRPH